MQVKDALRQHFPQLEVNGGNYPAPASKVFMAQILQVVQLSVVALAVAGDYIFTSLLNYPANGPFPPFYEAIREKRMMIGMGSWFVGNSISQSLTSTGAFEIAFDGKVIFSKLASQSHELPSLQQIIREMQRVQPDLVQRHAHSHPRGRPSVSTATKRSYQPSQSDDDDGINHDVHDLAYDEDNSR